MSRKLTIGHLYPAEMNIYGDMGNVITLVKRLEWRGYEATVVPIEIGAAVDLGSVDLLFGGGGQDAGQLIVANDLVVRGPELRAAAADGLPMLMICGLYQLFGHGFTLADGSELPGIGLFDAHTVAGKERMIGNIILDSPYGRLVGFENHSGRTTLADGQAALGEVVSGYGNGSSGKNRGKRSEGAVVNNAIGTYLHGSLLPKNPSLADHLIEQALRRCGITEALVPLDDTIERNAADVATKRPQ